MFVLWPPSRFSVSASIPETGWATLFDFETSKEMGVEAII